MIFTFQICILRYHLGDQYAFGNFPLIFISNISFPLLRYAPLSQHFNSDNFHFRDASRDIFVDNNLLATDICEYF